MDNLYDIGKDYKALAVQKIDQEVKDFKGDKYGEAVYTYVANALREFCSQDERFAMVLYKTKRSLSDCIKEIMRGCGKSISDIEVYRRAAKLYFPNSEVEFVMKISIVGEEPNDKYLLKEPKEQSEKAETPSKSENKTTQPKKSSKKKDDNVIQLSLY